MSWRRGKRCSSKRGIAWKLYRHKIAVILEGFEPSISGPQAAPSGPKRLILSGIPYAASTSCWVTRNWCPFGFVLKIILAPYFLL